MLQVTEKIIHIGEHGVPIPQPRSKDEILFYDDKDPVWNRQRLVEDYRDIWFEFLPNFTRMDQSATLYDQDGLLVSMNKDDSDYIRRIYEQETYRRIHGVHFKNGKDDITWITGDHYFALMWCKTQRHDGMGDYFDYREFQSHYFFYIIHLAWYYPYIGGAFWSKAKKTGITNLFWLYYLNRATMRKNKNFGYMSLDQPIAAKTFCDYFLYAYNNLVPALRPAYKNLSEVNGSIKFGNAYTNSKKARLIAYSTDNELNSNVFCVACAPKAFDVAVMQDIAFDEPTKYTKDFKEIYQSNKNATAIQSKINGRNWLFNYTEGYDTQSFRDARQLFYDSERSTIKQGQQETKSKLICTHIPAYTSWEGAFNKYGKCDEKKAMAEIQAEQDRYKDDPRQQQATIRAYANNKKQAWGSAGAGSVFDPVRFGELKAELELDQLHNSVAPYTDGHLDWDNNLWNLEPNRRTKGQFSKLKFVPLSKEDIAAGKEDKIRIYHDIPFADQNIALRNGRDEWNCLNTPDRFNYIIGGDPTNYAAGSEVIQGSKNAVYIFSVPDEKLDAKKGVIASKIMCIEYFFRPELPDEAFEDILKLILWTGCAGIIEANMPYTATRLIEEGLGKYMFVRDENGIIKFWERSMGLPKEEDKKYQLIRRTANATNNEMLETIVRVIKNYFKRVKPGSGEKDYGPTFLSERGLQQCMDFDPKETKLYDLVMALGYALFAMDLYIDILMFVNQDEYANPDNFVAVLDALAYNGR
jgi:hypothetical protein